MKRLVLALPPALFLLLSLDRLGPAPGRPPAPALARDWSEAAPALPAVDEGRGGRPGEPLSLVFVAAPRTLRQALTAAGWAEVPPSLRGSLSAGFAELLSGRRPAAFPPLESRRLRGRRQDMSWVLTPRPLLDRRGVRVWWTGMYDRLGRGYWWGSGDRDLALRTLSASPFLETSALIPLPRIPLEGINDKGRGYRTDGRAGVIVLRGPMDGVIRRPAGEGAGPSSLSRPRARNSAPHPQPRPTP